MTKQELQNKLYNWITRVDGQSIEREDSSNLDQCLDLAFDWIDTLGIPRETIRHFRAFQIYTQPNPSTTQYFDLIENTLTAVPEPGDIIIFGTSIGVSGHVSICKSADMNIVVSEDQNWDTNHYNRGIDPNTGLYIPYTREVRHPYNSILGWLRPKTINATTIPTPKPPLTGLDAIVGYKPSHEGQTVEDTNGVVYQSVIENENLVWKIRILTPEVPNVEIPHENIPSTQPTVVLAEPKTENSPSNQDNIDVYTVSQLFGFLKDLILGFFRQVVRHK